MLNYLCLAALLGAACIGEAAEYSTQDSWCKQGSGYYPIESSCDSYIECRGKVSNEMLCPDGLHFNPAAQWPAYPCGYPMDVPCQGRGAPQPAKPTAECPHQYGFYASALAAANDCGQYRMCVEGRAIEMLCPPGLAFNLANGHCDWPDLVPTCNTEAFLGFKCPASPLGVNGKPIQDVINYRYEGDCYAYFSCEEGRARLRTCDPGYAFSPAGGHCEHADTVRCEHADTVRCEHADTVRCETARPY